MKLEKMTDFFAVRIDGYDAHMKRDIIGATEFYAYTASLLPDDPKAHILDLGCGTGLELEEYFARNPGASVTGIDLSDVMLDALKAKFPDKALTVIQGSYFDVPLGENRYDGAVSVESLHHFPAEMKAALYGRLCAALKAGGVFVLTDYFAESPELERQYFQEFEAMKAELAPGDETIYHYDTPLTVEHEMDILRRAGFREVSAVHQWSGWTYTVCARK